MRKVLVIVLTILVITSCKKNSITEPAKVIDRVNIAPEYFVQKKNTGYYVGVQIFKNYTDADQVTLSFNGIEGKQINSSTDELSGNRILFFMPAVNNPVEGNLKLTIKNNQNTYNHEVPLRIVNDFSLNSVWNNLTKAYVLNFKGVSIIRLTTGDFRFSTYTGNINALNTFFIGYFIDDPTIVANIIGNETAKTFIDGLKGSYFTTYAGDVLTKLKIYQGGPSDNFYSPQKIYNDLAVAFGNPISQSTVGSEKITTYINSNFNIVTHETPNSVFEDGINLSPGIYTVITKK